MDQNTFTLNYGKLVARTWKEPAFLNQLKNDPVDTLNDSGLPVKQGGTVRVVVLEPTGQGTGDEQWEYWQRGDQSGTYDLFLPTKPADLQSGAMAESGGTYCCSCTPCCCCT